MSDRIAALQKMLERRPDDPRLNFGLALELMNAQRLEEAVVHLKLYLAQADDEGNAWGRLGEALRSLGRDEEARSAYREGIAAADRHGHPTMAAEFNEVLAEWD